MEIFQNTATSHLSLMFIAIFIFHMSEYLLATAIHGRRNVTLQSLLISKHYIIAMIFSVLEYLIEYAFFPALKNHLWLSYFGLALVLTGEFIRKLAILTAGRAFTHLIRTHREEQHKLVTHGIYSFVRHPSYIGFLIWSVGTQILILNPISTVAFAVVVWRFFFGRIPYEENYLRSFFGTEYVEYAQRVPSGIPFVK